MEYKPGVRDQVKLKIDLGVRLIKNMTRSQEICMNEIEGGLLEFTGLETHRIAELDKVWFQGE